jgi:hypothetical protein
MRRDPYDGMPYYCVVCGLGLEEFLSCEEPDDCELESGAVAKARQLRRRPVTSCAPDKET